MPSDNGSGVAAIVGDEGAQLLRIARQFAPVGRENFGSKSGDEASFGADGLCLGRGRGRFRLRRHGSFPLPHLRGELVAAVRDRDDQAWALGVRLDLATQADDLHVDAAVKSLGVPPR